MSETINKTYQRLHRLETDEIVEYAYDLESQLQQYKQQIDELEKQYIERIANGAYNDIYTIEDDNYYVNGETLLKEILEDLSKLKEKDVE